MEPKITTAPGLRYGGGLVGKLLRFSLVGGSGLIVNAVALYLLHELGHWPLTIAPIPATELAIVNNFLWNNWWTFGQRQLSAVRFLRFNLISLGGLAITWAVVNVLSSYGVYYQLANLLGVGLATFWNFGLNVLWTWRLQS